MRMLILILLLICYSSFACDCVTVVGLKDAKHVFEGEVLKIRRTEVPYIRYEITFKISKTIKGDLVNDTLIVNTPCLNAGCCGIPFEVKDKYRVYTFIRYDKLYTGECTETIKLDKQTK